MEKKWWRTEKESGSIVDKGSSRRKVRKPVPRMRDAAVTMKLL